MTQSPIVAFGFFASPIALKAKSGHRLDKIATLDCMDEIRGFKWGVSEFGPPMNPAETSALAHRAVHVQRGGR